MAGFNLTVNSTFQPFSLDRYLKPYQVYGEAYDKVENQYNDYATKSNVWEGMADVNKDPITYRQYKKYADALKASADELATNGLSVNTKKALSNLKSRYSSEIIPIEQAYKTRAAEAADQQKGRNADGSIMYSREAANTSLDDYLQGNTTPYSHASGVQIQNEVANAAKALSTSLSSYSLGDPIDDYTNSFLVKYGYSPNQVLRAINNPNSENSNSVLSSIVESAVNNSGVKNWGDKNKINKAYGYARQGLWNAIGQTKITPTENYKAKYDATHPNATTTANGKLTPDQLKGINHVPYYIKESADTKNLKGIENKVLSTSYDGLSHLYTGPKNVNPMKIYEKYHSVVMKNTQTGDAPNLAGAIIEGHRVNTERKKIADSYGVSEDHILTNKEYESLKSLGYNSNMDASQIKASDIKQLIENRTLLHSDSSVNLVNFAPTNTQVVRGLDRWKDGSYKGLIYEYDNGVKGKPIKSVDDLYSKTAGGKTINDVDVRDVGYTSYYPEFLTMDLGGKNVLIDPTVISQEASDIIKEAAEKIRAANGNKQNITDIQDITTFKIKQILNGFNKTASSTDSSINKGY